MSIFVSSESIATRTGRNRGVPPTQGHKFLDPRTGRMIEQMDHRIKVWRLLIRTQVNVAGWTTISEGPVACHLDFLLPRGTSRRLWHSAKPDIDTMSRAVLDGLTRAKVWGDDSQVAILTARKRVTTTGQVGVHIRVEPITDEGQVPR